MSQLNHACKFTHLMLALSGVAIFASAPQRAIGQQPIAIADQDNFRIELLGCARDYETIQCKYKLTNTGRIDTELTFRRDARIVTTNGDEAKSKFVQFGSTSSDNPDIYKQMVTNVPLLASHKFSPTPRNANSIAVLELSFYSSIAKSESKVQFRNINITSPSR